MSIIEMWNNLDPVVIKNYFTTLGILIIPFIILQIKNIVYKIADSCCGFWADKACKVKQQIDWDKKEELRPEFEMLRDKGRKYNTVTTFISKWIEVDNPIDHPIRFLYLAFWIIGGCIMTFVAIVWIIIGISEGIDQNSKLVDAQNTYYNVMLFVDNPNELHLKKAEELNDLFEREVIFRKTFYAIKPEIVETYKQNLHIEEEDIRAKVAKKWNAIDVVESMLKDSE